MRGRGSWHQRGGVVCPEPEHPNPPAPRAPPCTPSRGAPMAPPLRARSPAWLLPAPPLCFRSLTSSSSADKRENRQLRKVVCQRTGTGVWSGPGGRRGRGAPGTAVCGAQAWGLRPRTLGTLTCQGSRRVGPRLLRKPVQNEEHGTGLRQWRGKGSVCSLGLEGQQRRGSELAPKLSLTVHCAGAHSHAAGSRFHFEI